MCIAVIVEDVVNDLKCGAQCLTVGCTRCLGFCIGTCQHGTQASAGFKQFGCLGSNDEQVARFV